MKERRAVLRWACRIFLVIIALLVLFIFEERIRGHVMLVRRKAQLRAEGEKLTLAELGLAKPVPETDRGAALLGIAAQISNSAGTRYETAYVPEEPVLIKPGVAIVIHKQWGPVERGYPRGSGLAGSWSDLSSTMQLVRPLLDKAGDILRKGRVSFPVNYDAGIGVRLPHLNHAVDLCKWFGAAIR